MKHIIKVNEPQELINWKLSDKMYLRGKPNWNRLNSTLKDVIKIHISQEQGYICCYCEREIFANDSHIEHFKPKNKNKFPQEQLNYNNLLCSCQLECDQGEPRHCGPSKGSWYIEDKLVSPLDSDCEEKFKYTNDGQILPKSENDKDAKTTIKKLQLDIDKLNKLREKAIEPFIDDLSEEELNMFVKGYLADRSANNGRYNEFYTTIKYLFGNTKEEKIQ